MTHHKKRLLLTVALIPAIGLSGETVYPDIVTKYPIKSDLVKYFPYSTVRIIDNRMDTTKIYTEQTGKYPPSHANFNEPAPAVVKKYIDSTVRDSKRGNGELLINIQQLYIANIHHTMAEYDIRKAINDGADRKLNRKMENRMIAEELKHNYRYCTLNMDNGDVLYNDKSIP